MSCDDGSVGAAIATLLKSCEELAAGYIKKLGTRLCEESQSGRLTAASKR